MGALAVAAGILLPTACGQHHEAIRICVDETGTTVADSNCEAASKSGPHKYAWVYTRPEVTEDDKK
jgi:hypothetical protein